MRSSSWRVVWESAPLGGDGSNVDDVKEGTDNYDCCPSKEVSWTGINSDVLTSEKRRKS